MEDLKRRYIAEAEPCDTPEYRFDMTRRDLGFPGAGLLLTLRRGDAAEPLARLHAADDGTITLLTGKIEMGQGSRTVLTQVVAEEMHADPARVRVIMGDTSLVPDDGGTWASLTCAQTVPVVRKAAAEMHRSAPVEPAEWKVCGTSLPKVAGRDIVTGAHQYISDIRVPGMRHGRVIRAPGYRAKLLRFTAPDGVTPVRSGNLLGVVGATPAEAERIAASVKAEWSVETLPDRDAMLESFITNGIAPKPGEGGRYPALVTAGDAGSALARVERKFEARYVIRNIAHASLEPRAAIAEWKNGKLTVWSGCQAPFLVRKELATAFRIPETDVRIISADCGGAFGGKQRGECEIEAAWLAREAGAPVRLAWSREEEFTASYCRPAGVVEMRAALDGRGRITAWQHRNYNAGAASLSPPYAIADYSCEYWRADSPLRQGSYRSLAGVANTFAREAFTDELAVAAGVDPLEFRLRNIEDARLKHVLERAAEKFGWRNAKQTGVACNLEKDARLALFVEMEGTKVRRAVAAVDPGAIINPAGLRAQIEGGIIQGIGGALFEELRFDARRVTNASLTEYRVPKFSDAPRIEVILIDRRDIASAGCGEAPITLPAPAIRHALGPTPQRPFRSLPLL